MWFFKSTKMQWKIKFADVIFCLNSWRHECFCKYSKMSKDGTAEQFKYSGPIYWVVWGRNNRRKLFLTVRRSPNLPSPYRPTHPPHEQEPIILIIRKKTMCPFAKNEGLTKQIAIRMKSAKDDFSDCEAESHDLDRQF